MKAWIASLLALAVGLSAANAARAAGDYLDDRSDARALVRSLYNAIDRKEYARAYGYFAEPPADSVEAFARGYEDTGNVELLTGAAAQEGAAGSVFTTLPVAIRATMGDGSEKVFAGCYTTRLANPRVQADAFTPLLIEDGTLEPAEGPLESALPESCGDAPADEPVDRTLEAAKARFDALYRETCQVPQRAEGSDTGEDGGAPEPETYTLRFSRPHENADAPKHEARLFRFLCTSGAYNQLHVYFLADEDGRVSPVQFATPELSIHYVDDDPEGEVDDMRIVGYTAEDRLMNSQYDPDTLTVTSHDFWRGLGDASAQGIWAFRHGSFSLVKYDVDPTYDGEVNPQPMLDFYTGP